MNNKELLKKMQEERDSAYRVFREAELTEDEKYLAYVDGVLSGINRMIDIVQKSLEE